MDPVIEEHLEELRSRLQARRQILRAELQAAHAAGLPPADAGEVLDQKDLAQLEQRAEVDAAQVQRDLEDLVEVDAALHRIEAGTYGDCIMCGAVIAWPRLRVQPAARRCADCQAEHERSHDHGHGHTHGHGHPLDLGKAGQGA